MKDTFQLARLCLRNVVLRMSVSRSQCRIALVQFSSTARVENINGQPGFAEDANSILNAIQSARLLLAFEMIVFCSRVRAQRWR